MPERSVRANVIHTGEIGEAWLGLSGTEREENRMLEGLIIFLTEQAEGVRVSGSPGDMSSKVAGTCAHLMNAAAYKPWKGSKRVRHEAGTVRIGEGHQRTCVQPVGEK